MLVAGAGLLLALPGWSKVDILIQQVADGSLQKPTVRVQSQAAGSVRFTCVGRGFLKTSTLEQGDSEELNPANYGVYQFRLSAGSDQSRGLLPLEEGKRTEVLITGTASPDRSPRFASSSGELKNQAPGEPIRIPNPFGPAFEKLSIDEKIRLVEDSPEAQSLSSSERGQLLGILYNEKGVQEANSKNFETAEEILRKAQQLLADENTVRMNLAFAMAGNGNQKRLEGSFNLADKKLGEALALAEGSGDGSLVSQIHSARAALYVDQALAMPGSEQRRRTTLFEKALEENPDHAAALFNLGQIAYQEYDLETALDYFERAYQQSPQPDLAKLIDKVRIEIEEAGDFVTQDRGVFKISFEGSEVKHVARETRKLLADAEREVGRKFVLRPKGAIPVVIYSAGQFQQILGLHSWAGGAYDGKIRLPIADLSEADIDQGRDKLRELVFHEFTHALLHNRTSPAHIPVWLHEGLAQNAAGQNPDNPMLHAQLIDSLNSGRIPMPSRLAGDFTGIADPGLASQVYLESYLFIKYLLDKQGGWSRIKSLVSSIEAGESLEASFRKAYRKSLDELEQRWIKEL